MEITEVVTPSVAIPVLGVLVCAFLVFAFGFKSPGQPPSFDALDEESKKKKNRKAKGKSQSNGHALTVPDETNSSAKPQPSPKQTKQAVKQVASAKVKQASLAPEQPKKAKKTPVVKEIAKEPPVASKEQENLDEDDDGWHTISKKDKKQKKKEERGETPIEEKYVAMEKQQVVVEETIVMETEEKQEVATASPQDQRQKKKRDKKAKKAKLEQEVQEVVHQEPEPEKNESQEPAIDIEIIPEPAAQPQLEVVAENNVELHIQDAMETQETQEEEVHVVKKKSKNKKKKQSPALEAEPASVPVQQDSTQPKLVLEEEGESVEPESKSTLSPAGDNTEEKAPVTTKSPKKKQKKERRKGNTEPKSVEPEEDVGGASGVVEPSLSQSLTDVSKQSPKITEMPQNVVTVASPGSEAAAAQSPGASFDELGDLSESWTEAKPKSKKKKARREN